MNLIEKLDSQVDLILYLNHLDISFVVAARKTDVAITKELRLINVPK